MVFRTARLLGSGAGPPLDSPGGDSLLVEVHVNQGRFLALPPSGTVAVEARTVVDAAGALVSPPYVEPHVHLDSCLTAGEPRWNASGTLWEGIACWAERKPLLTREDVIGRVEEVLRSRVPPETVPRIGAAVTSAGRVYLDHSRDIGAFNPCFPEYTFEEARNRRAAFRSNRRDFDHSVIGKPIFVGVRGRLRPSGMSIRHKDLWVVERATPMQNSLIGQRFQKGDDRIDFEGV